MKAIVVVNLFQSTETARVEKLAKRFKSSLRVVAPQPVDFATTWTFESMDKRTVEWTKRLLRKFLAEETTDVLIKIDPDTQIVGRSFPTLPDGADVAGDFRKSSIGWIWFGACQFFSRSAVTRIVEDPQYVGSTLYQDVALAQSVIRLKLKAFNMPEVDGWSKTPSAATIIHPGRSNIDRLVPGFVNF